jgi:hypothetical protein
VAAGHRDGVDHLRAEFRGKPGKLGFRERSQISGDFNLVEEGCFRGLGHRISLIETDRTNGT